MFFLYSVDDQRQTEMERQDNIEPLSSSDNASAPKQTKSISFLSSHTELVSNRFLKDQQTSNYNSHRFLHRESKGEKLSFYQDLSPQERNIERPNLVVKESQQRSGLSSYRGNPGQTTDMITSKFDEQLERGMQHFLTSEMEASQDLSHPWHDMMSSKASARQRAAPSFGSDPYNSSMLPLLKTGEAQFDHFSFGGDDPSPNSIYPMQSWGRGDFPPGGSSPDSSSSDSHNTSGHFLQSPVISPSSPSSTLTRSSHTAGGITSPRTSSSSSPSVSSEASLALEPLPEEGRIMLDAVNGFLLMLDSDARVLFVSENVTEHLGYQQVGRPSRIIVLILQARHAMHIMQII